MLKTTYDAQDVETEWSQGVKVKEWYTMEKDLSSRYFETQ